MAFGNLKDFNHRLMELNRWQMEQQKKLKEFQENQKKLLDADDLRPSNQSLLSNINVQLCNWKNKFCEQAASKKEQRNCNVLQDCDNDGVIQVKCNSSRTDIMLEPNNGGCDLETLSIFDSESNSGIEKRDVHGKRQFLRRGDGLARFRMKLEDFKSTPDIYKEKKIKTYLNRKSESQIKNTRPKIFKSSKRGKVEGPSELSKTRKKATTVSVKIYAPEQKFNETGFPTNCDKKKRNPVHIYHPASATGTSNTRNNCIAKMAESLKGKATPLSSPTVAVRREKNDLRESDDVKRSGVVEADEDPRENHLELEIEKKKDDKELKLFEILEQKVNESSFCSSSSLIDKLMYESMTPTKSDANNCGNRHETDLKSPDSPRILNANPFGNVENLYEFPVRRENDRIPESRKGENADAGNVVDDFEPINQETEEKKENGGGFGGAEDVTERVIGDETTKADVSRSRNNQKKLLQEYVRNFRNFKSTFNPLFIERMAGEENGSFPETTEDSEELKKDAIAVTLRRKGLQDNVKQLMNWECSPRKKFSVKRNVKKPKPKGKKAMEKSMTSNKEESEKIIFDGAALRERLEELEKEIAIFRRENGRVEKLQRECREERLKLSKERREFEKSMREEREKLEAKVAESQKKLQKERTVFETYCKQANGRPNRQEREEIARLKKELEKLTEAAAAKDARWGASQARLRNQMRTLEKENFQLKAENEKLKKSNAKKVTFGREKSVEAKIIRAINSELGKLRPTVTNLAESSRSCACISGGRQREKALRRISSAPNMKRPFAVDPDVGEDVSSDEADFRLLDLTSTDSGIEANERKADFGAEGKKRVEGSNGSGMEESKRADRKKSSNTRGDAVETIVRETIFDDRERSNLSKSETASNPEEKPNVSRNSETNEETDTRDCRNSDSNEECDEFEIREFGRRNLGEIRTRESISMRLRENFADESRKKENDYRERTLQDGTKEIFYPNGNVKKISPDNKTVKIIYYNGDVKETDYESGSEKYYYSETETWHTTYKDGMEVIEFPTGQTERRYADGSSEISFPNGCRRYCDSSGRDEWRFSDGTVIKTNESGHKILLLTNGQKEIHTDEFKQREYPDGTVKILYSNGSQETRYASGRVRLKDKDGHLLMDSGGI